MNTLEKKMNLGGVLLVVAVSLWALNNVDALKPVKDAIYGG